MSSGFFGYLLRLSDRRRPALQFARAGTRSRPPFLEGLETRALPARLIAAPDLVDVAAVSTGSLATAPETVLVSPVVEPQSGDVGGQGDGPQIQHGGPRGNRLQLVVVPVVQITLDPVDILPIRNGNRQGDNSQQTGTANVQDDPTVSQGDGPNGPSDNTENSSATDPADGQSTQGQGQLDGQNDQGDGSTSLVLDNTGHPCNTATGTDSSDNPTSDSPSDCQNGEQPDADQGSTMDNVAVSSPGGRNGTSPGNLGDYTNNGSVLGTEEEINAGTSSQNNMPEKKPTSPSSISFLEGEQHSLGNTADGRQHGPDGNIVAGEELRSLVFAGVPDPEPHSRNQPGLQNGAMESAGRQLQERMPLTETFPRPTLAETPRVAGEEILAPVVYDAPEDPAPAEDRPKASPQNHGLLTDSLALEFSSLRSEVQKFFDQINNLGTHATERQISVVLCSGAIVVAAAMACEVARRQARQPAPLSSLALIPKLDVANDADTSSGIGPLNVGQISTFS